MKNFMNSFTLSCIPFAVELLFCIVLLVLFIWFLLSLFIFYMFIYSLKIVLLDGLCSCMRWIPEVWKFSQRAGFQKKTPLKAIVCYCHGYGDTCTFFVEGLWLDILFELIKLELFRQLGYVTLNVYNTNYSFRNCPEVSFGWIWSFRIGLPWIWPFRRSSWIYSQLRRACWWCYWAFLQG